MKHSYSDKEKLETNSYIFYWNSAEWNVKHREKKLNKNFIYKYWKYKPRKYIETVKKNKNVILTDNAFNNFWKLWRH